MAAAHARSQHCQPLLLFSASLIYVVLFLHLSSRYLTEVHVPLHLLGWEQTCIIAISMYMDSQCLGSFLLTEVEVVIVNPSAALWRKGTTWWVPGAFRMWWQSWWGLALHLQFRRNWRRQEQLSQWEMCSAHSHKDAGCVTHLRLITTMSAVGISCSITEDPSKSKEMYEKGGRHLNTQCYHLSYHFWFSCAA